MCLFFLTHLYKKKLPNNNKRPPNKDPTIAQIITCLLFNKLLDAFVADEDGLSDAFVVDEDGGTVDFEAGGEGS